MIGQTNYVQTELYIFEADEVPRAYAALDHRYAAYWHTRLGHASLEKIRILSNIKCNNIDFSKNT